MNRRALDTFAHHHQLNHAGISAALDLTGNRPDTVAWRSFAQRLLRGAGVGALGAGIIFFVAANWQDYGVMGRFVLLQTALLLSVGVALWRPPPHAVGQAALVLATLLTGTVLALFGQAYQTGADVYELFVFWALLSLPFALAALSGAVWAIWWGVLNVALALYFGWLDPNHGAWALIDRFGIGKPLAMLAPCAINLAGAAAFIEFRRTRFAAAAPLWLIRTLAVFGFLYGTLASMAVVGSYRAWERSEVVGGQDIGVLLTFAALCALVAYLTLERKRDVFPMALITASAIAISTTAIIRHTKFNDLGAFFLIALWLIGASTGASLLLMHWLRTWRAADASASAAAGAAA